MTTFEQKIKDMRFEDSDDPQEWWHVSSKNTFIKAGKELLKRGFSESEALCLLGKLFHATAEEYGDY
ncbi:MAG: hypothetical protein PHX80_03950 [Candidatus Nanoarchaeia archaeon]|nr:hypothetical protein [Candidatus Nanoarchaeia archaeon]